MFPVLRLLPLVALIFSHSVQLDTLFPAHYTVTCFTTYRFSHACHHLDVSCACPLACFPALVNTYMFPALVTGYMSSRACHHLDVFCACQHLHVSRASHRLHVFPRLPHVTCFPALFGTYIFPAIATCYIFPALATGYMFSRPCTAAVTCFQNLALFVGLCH